MIRRRQNAGDDVKTIIEFILEDMANAPTMEHLLIKKA
jgi:hypothetical protein